MIQLYGRDMIWKKNTLKIVSIDDTKEANQKNYVTCQRRLKVYELLYHFMDKLWNIHRREQNSRARGGPLKTTSS